MSKSAREAGEYSKQENAVGAAESVSGRRETTSLKSIATSLLLIVLVALALRIGFAWYNADHNSHQALGVIPFLFESGNISYSLAQGHGFASPFRVPTGPTAWMTPIYPALTSGVFRVFGVNTFHSYVAAAALNILFSALTCIPIFFAGKRIADTGTGAIAAWLWALFPNAILIPYESMWEACLAALLAAMILWATLALLDSDSPRRWAAYGLLWGAALMTNATLLLLAPFLFGWLIYVSRKGSSPEQPLTRRAVRPILAAAVAVLCCVPWSVRNYAEFHSFVPLRSVLGLQLWMGNSEHAQDIWRGTYHPIFNSAERAHYIDIGEIAYMREKQHMAIDYMISHPHREAHLIWHRFLAFWAGGTPYPIADFLHVHSIWYRYVLAFNLIVAVAALCGIVILFRKRSTYAIPVSVFPLVFPWAYYLTIVEPRYSLPIEPAVMVLAAAAVSLCKSENLRPREHS